MALRNPHRHSVAHSPLSHPHPHLHPLHSHHPSHPPPPHQSHHALQTLSLPIPQAHSHSHTHAHAHAHTHHPHLTPTSAHAHLHSPFSISPKLLPSPSFEFPSSAVSAASNPPPPLPHSPPTTPATSLVLRSSCDSCAAAKVKCDKAHPRCNRCAASHTECVYGVSRKHGRRTNTADSAISNKRRALSRHGVPTPAVLSQRASPPRSAISYGPPLMPDVVASPVAVPSPTVVPSPVSAFSSDPSGDAATLYDFGGFDSVYHPPPPPPPPPVGLAGFDVEPLGGVPAVEVEATSFSTAAEPGPPLPAIGPVEHIAPVEPLTAAEDSMAALEPDSSAAVSCAAPETCFFRTRASLDSLHHANSSRLDGTTSLQQMLRANRDAIQTISQLLQCRCARDASLAMLAASIIAQVLCLYRTAAQMPSPGSSPAGDPGAAAVAAVAAGGGSGSSSGSQLVSPTLSEASGFSGQDNSSTTVPSSAQEVATTAPTAAPMAMDDFDLEQEDHNTMRRLLLMSELRKAARIIDRFISKPTEMSDTNGFGALGAGLGLGLGPSMGLDMDMGLGRTGDVYPMLGLWLKKEVNGMIHDFRSRVF